MLNLPQTFKQGETYWCTPDPADTIGSEQQGDRIWVIVSLRTRSKVVVAVPLSRHIEKATAPFLVTVPASGTGGYGPGQAVPVNGGSTSQSLPPQRCTNGQCSESSCDAGVHPAVEDGSQYMVLSPLAFAFARPR